MIFVTVGTFQFDALVRQVDSEVGRGEITSNVMIQIGTGSYEPINCDYFRSAPGLDDQYARADLVIGHGGTGTTLEVLERGIRLVSVCNPSLIDDHQHGFLEALDNRGLILYCRRLEELASCVRDYLQRPPPRPIMADAFFKHAIADLETLKR